jgi:hypothetical protein
VDLRTTVATAPCPDCGRKVKLGSRPKEGQQLACTNCGTYLEIIGLEPPELDWAFNDLPPVWESEDEDWDEEWDEGENDSDDEGSDY